MRSQVQTLQQQQAPLAEQLTTLQTDKERLSNQVAQTKDSQALSQAQLNELLKLRAKATAAQTDSRERARLKAAPAQPTGKIPDSFTNWLARSMSTGRRVVEKSALDRLSRMKQMLSLTDDQEQAIGNIMTNRIPRHSQLRQDLIAGTLTPEQYQAQDRALGDEEAGIKALLTPEQLAAYPEFQQAEKTTVADNNAKYEAGKIAGSFSLPQDQQEKLRGLLSELNLKVPDRAPSQQAINEVNATGNLADAVSMSVELQKWQLEEKLKILAGFLSPDQLATYRQEQMERIEQMASAAKTFPLPKPAAAAN
jgi:hypothetical protein